MKTLEGFLIQKDACKDGFDFAKDLTLEQFLNTCERGDWILWLFAEMNPDCLRELTLAKAHCANTVRHLMKDATSIKAVDVAIAFGEGRATRKELYDAAYTANAAAAYTANAVYFAANAAYAAGYAADADAYAADADAVYFANAAGSAATYAANAAAYAAGYAAAYVAGYAAAYFGAKKQNQKLTAEICRKYLPLEIWNNN